MGVVEQPVQQSSGQNIVAEQFPPITEILVAGQDDTAVLIPFRDQAEQQLSLLAVQLHVPNLVNHQHSRAQIDPPPAFQAPLQLSLLQIRNEVREGGVINHHTGIQRLERQTNSQVGFAHPGGSQQDDIFLSGNEGQRTQLLYLPFVDAGLERKVKVLQALAVRQPGQLQPGFPALSLALLLFRRKQFIEKLHISLLCVEGLLQLGVQKLSRSLVSKIPLRPGIASPGKHCGTGMPGLGGFTQRLL